LLLLWLHTARVVISAAVGGNKLMGYFNRPRFAWGWAKMDLGTARGADY